MVAPTPLFASRMHCAHCVEGRYFGPFLEEVDLRARGRGAGRGAARRGETERGDCGRGTRTTKVKVLSVGMEIPYHTNAAVRALINALYSCTLYTCSTRTLSTPTKFPKQLRSPTWRFGRGLLLAQAALTPDSASTKLGLVEAAHAHAAVAAWVRRSEQNVRVPGRACLSGGGAACAHRAAGTTADAASAAAAALLATRRDHPWEGCLARAPGRGKG